MAADLAHIPVGYLDVSSVEWHALAHCLHIKTQAETSDTACMPGARYHQEPL